MTFAARAARAVVRRPRGRRLVEPGSFTLAVGGGQPGAGGAYASPVEGVVGQLVVSGETLVLE